MLSSGLGRGGRKRLKSKSDDGSKSGSRTAGAVTEGTTRGDGSDLLATHNVSHKFKTVRA